MIYSRHRVPYQGTFSLTGSHRLEVWDVTEGFAATFAFGSPVSNGPLSNTSARSATNWIIQGSIWCIDSPSTTTLQGAAARQGWKARSFWSIS
jgi:hypothetical protein